MENLKNEIEFIRTQILKDGFIQDDKRFNRKTKALDGMVYVINKSDIEGLQKEVTLPKYKEDWIRMTDTLAYCWQEYNRDPESRRLVALNTDKYLEIFPCFLSMQFIKGNGKMGAVVYQRSGDVEKMYDDFMFFSHLVEQFELNTKAKIDYIKVIYGNIHTTYKDEDPERMELQG